MSAGCSQSRLRSSCRSRHKKDSHTKTLENRKEKGLNQTQSLLSLIVQSLRFTKFYLPLPNCSKMISAILTDSLLLSFSLSFFLVQMDLKLSMKNRRNPRIKYRFAKNISTKIVTNSEMIKYIIISEREMEKWLEQTKSSRHK